MQTKELTILCIDHDSSRALALKLMLQELSAESLQLCHVPTLALGIERLLRGGISMVLLGLPDEREGLSAYSELAPWCGGMPIVVLAGEDEYLGLRALELGAQDYLLDHTMRPTQLLHTIRAASIRQEHLELVRANSLIDDLTGLHNRRGFFKLAEQYRRLADRMGRRMVLLFIDLDGLKVINDTHGHGAGSNAIVEAAMILRRTFRETDLLARLGGDEFVVLAPDCSPEGAALLIARLQEQLAHFTTPSVWRYTLAMSVGWALYDSASPISLEALLLSADKAMYEEKRAKRRHTARGVDQRRQRSAG